MKKLTLEHSEAVSAAKLLLIYKATNEHPARYRALLEKQIELLGDVYWWVLHGIYNPGLPFTDEQLAKDIEQLHEDPSHGPTSRQD